MHTVTWLLGGAEQEAIGPRLKTNDCSAAASLEHNRNLESPTHAFAAGGFSRTPNTTQATPTKVLHARPIRHVRAQIDQGKASVTADMSSRELRKAPKIMQVMHKARS